MLSRRGSTGRQDNKLCCCDKRGHAACLPVCLSGASLLSKHNKSETDRAAGGAREHFTWSKNNTARALTNTNN